MLAYNMERSRPSPIGVARRDRVPACWCYLCIHKLCNTGGAGQLPSDSRISTMGERSHGLQTATAAHEYRGNPAKSV